MALPEEFVRMFRFLASYSALISVHRLWYKPGDQYTTIVVPLAVWLLLSWLMKPTTLMFWASNRPSRQTAKWVAVTGLILQWTWSIVYKVDFWATIHLLPYMAWTFYVFWAKSLVVLHNIDNDETTNAEIALSAYKWVMPTLLPVDWGSKFWNTVIPVSLGLFCWNYHTWYNDVKTIRPELYYTGGTAKYIPHILRFFNGGKDVASPTTLPSTGAEDTTTIVYGTDNGGSGIQNTMVVEQCGAAAPHAEEQVDNSTYSYRYLFRRIIIRVGLGVFDLFMNRV